MLPACSNSRPHPRAEPRAIEVLEIGASEYDPTGARGDGPTLAADCKRWSLTRQQVETFFRHSQPIADGAGNAFYALPCHIAGRLRAEGRTWDFRINAAATATWTSGEDIRWLGCTARECESLVLLMPDDGSE
jgi:hypothetical protein